MGITITKIYKFKCGICLETNEFDNMTKYEKYNNECCCKQLYCKKCLENVLTCPQCRKLKQQKDIITNIEKFAENLIKEYIEENISNFILKCYSAYYDYEDKEEIRQLKLSEIKKEYTTKKGNTYKFTFLKYDLYLIHGYSLFYIINELFTMEIFEKKFIKCKNLKDFLNKNKENVKTSVIKFVNKNIGDEYEKNTIYFGENDTLINPTLKKILNNIIKDVMYYGADFTNLSNKLFNEYLQNNNGVHILNY